MVDEKYYQNKSLMSISLFYKQVNAGTHLYLQHFKTVSGFTTLRPKQNTTLGQKCCQILIKAFFKLPCGEPQNTQEYKQAFVPFFIFRQQERLETSSFSDDYFLIHITAFVRACCQKNKIHPLHIIDNKFHCKAVFCASSSIQDHLLFYSAHCIQRLMKQWALTNPPQYAGKV